MRVLALDTVSPFPAVALRAESGSDTREDAERFPSRAAESLVRGLLDLLRRMEVEPREIDRVAVLSGPGSFTGLKAGAAFARGLARAIGAPLVSFSTFEAASAAWPDPASADFIVEAGRGEVHRARRRRSGLQESPAPVPRPEARAEAAADGVPICDLGIEALPLAVVLARLAAAPDVSGGARTFRPEYGRLSAAEEKLGTLSEEAVP